MNETLMNSLEEIDRAFWQLCNKNSSEEIKIFLELNPVYIKEIKNFTMFTESIRSLCKHNNLNTIEYLFSISELRERMIELEGAILATCSAYTKIELLKYFLVDNPYKKFNINANNGHALLNACRTNSVESVKYLLTDKELSTHADITIRNYEAFRAACVHKDLKVIHYLFFDYNLAVNEQLKEHIEMRPKVKALLEIKQIYHTLNKDLTPLVEKCNTSEKKLKI